MVLCRVHRLGLYLSKIQYPQTREIKFKNFMLYQLKFYPS